MKMYEFSNFYTFDTCNRQRSSERLTPHKLTVMCMTHEYHQMVKEGNERDDTGSQKPKLTDKERRIFMVLLLELLQWPDMDLKSLRQKIDGKVCDLILTNVYARLSMISQSGVGPLQDFMEKPMVEPMPTPLTPTDEGVIKRDSIMGLYIRRMLIAYKEMSFSQVVELFHKVKNYYEDAFPESRESKLSVETRPSPPDSGGALHLTHLEQSRTETLDSLSVFSRKQAEYCMARQAHILGHNPGQALPPDELQVRLRDILAANPDIAEAHFLSYMNNLRVKEYCMALHNLHHYFDRKACAPIEGSSKDKSGHSEEVAMRYAALNLASLHFRFGNKEECKAALQEAIMLAQEGNDQVCLQHALVWSNLLDENHMAVTQLENSVKKTVDLELPGLTVYGLNSLNKALGLGTELPARVIYYFTQSNLINCMHSNYSMMASGCAQRAAMWHYYGKRHLSALDSHVVLNLDTSVNGTYYSGQAVCVAMCNLAQQHADLGEYSAANEILSQARVQFPVGTSEADVWQACQQRVVFNRAIYARRWRDCQQALINLQAVDKDEANIRKAILLREKGQVTEAFDCLHKLLAACERDKSKHNANYTCRVLLELSALYISTGQSTSALLHVTDCIARASNHHLEQLEALATAHLAYIQLLMDLPGQAVHLLECRLLRVFTNCGSYDKARVLHLYARCKVAAARMDQGADTVAELKSAVKLMSTVSQLYHNLEAHLREKDALHLEAVLHHLLMTEQAADRQHHQEERNRCARQFKVLDKLYPTLGTGGVAVL